MIRCVFLAVALSAGNAEFDRVAAEGAADISLNRMVSRLCVEGPRKGILAEGMLSNPKEFVSRAEAEKKCREMFEAALHESFERGKRGIEDRLGVTNTVSRKLGGDPLATAMKLFAERFASERSAVLKEQAGRITSTVRPTESEIESQDVASVVKSVAARIVAAQKTPVFEENLAYVSDSMAKPLVEAGHKELARQRAYVSRARSDAATPAAMSADIEERLRKNVASERSRRSDGGWGVFSSVLSKDVPEVVARRMSDRLVSAVEALDVKVSPEEIAREISADPARHVKVSESRRIFRERYASSMAASALAKVADAAPAAEKAAVVGYLSKLLPSPRFQRSLDARIRRDVMPDWAKARKAAAEMKARELWPSLAGGTWYPEAALADEVCARSDYSKAVGRWRSFDAMREMASVADETVTMEECARFADLSVAKAFDTARNAIAGQLEITERIHPEVLGISRRRKESWFSRTPDLAAVIAMLTERTLAEWTERKNSLLWAEGERPENADDQHAVLFPSVTRRIELLARQILEEMNEPEPEKEESVEDTDSEGDSDVEQMEFSILVSKQGGNVEVKLEKGDTAIFERTVPARKGDFKSAMGEVTEKISSELKL